MPNVEYTLSLKDHMTRGLHDADAATQKLTSSMGELMSTLGLAFGAYQLTEYFTSAREEFEKIDQATHQLEAGLESTHHAAGISMQELTEQAEHFSHVFKYTKGEVMDMQSIILTFPGISKQVYGDASQAILDMSAKLHYNIKDVAIMVGKALQDPQTGIMAMRRVGVNFTKEQSEMVQGMVKSGHLMKAQAFILHELQNEFAGSAAANAAADPLFEYNKAMEETREQVGALIVEIQKELAPTLLELAHHFRELVDWIGRNGHEIWSIIKALGAAFIAFKTGSTVVAGYTALMEALAPAEAAAATATEGVAAASTAALGPIGLIAAAIGGLAYVYSELANNAKIAEDQIKQMADANAGGERETIASLIQAKKLQFGLGDKETTGMVVYAETARLSKAVAAKKKEVEDLKKEFKNAGMFDDTAVIGGKLTKGMSDLESLKAQLAAAKEYGSSPKEVKGTSAGTTAPGTKTQTKNAKANRNETINIHIGALVKELDINTTNIKEGAGKLQEMISQVLMNAVNNSQIIANH